MSDQTPDRLREFRAQYMGKSSGAQLWVPMIVTWVLLGLVLVSVWLRPSGVGSAISEQADGAAPATGGLNAESLRAYAVYLSERQEPLAAVAAYRAYLEKVSLEAKERANVCYTMAKLAMDAQSYEDALPLLYESEYLDPNSDLKEEINKKVVFCLDKLGRRVDLRKELRKRTAVKRTASDVEKTEVVLAEFAGEVITDRDLDVEIEKLPPYLRESLTTPEKRTEFLKNMVAQRLLVEKARRLALDQDPEVVEAMGKQVDALIVQKLIEDEVKANIRISPADVERFYKATLDRFTEPASAELRVGEAGSEEGANGLAALPEKTVSVRKGGELPGVGNDSKAAEAVFGAEAGKRVGPFEAKGKWYVFEVVSSTPEKVKPFGDVQREAEQLYRMQKEREEVSALVERTLKEQDVKLHLERVTEANAVDSVSGAPDSSAAEDAQGAVSSKSGDKPETPKMTKVLDVKVPAQEENTAAAADEPVKDESSR